MADKTQNKSENWMRILLLGSLGLNVFLAGFLFAQVLAPSTKTDPSPVRISMGALPNDLPMELREELEDNFRLHAGEVEQSYQELAKARVRVKEILEVEELDQDALKEALAEIRELQIKVQIPMHQVLIEAAMGLDADTRGDLIFIGERFDGQGLWDTRKFDGARWKVEIENGEIIIDMDGITDNNGDEREKD